MNLAPQMMSVLQSYFRGDRDLADVRFAMDPDSTRLRMYQGIGRNIKYASWEIGGFGKARSIADDLELLIREIKKTAALWNPRPWWDQPFERPYVAGKWRKWHKHVRAA